MHIATTKGRCFRWRGGETVLEEKTRECAMASMEAAFEAMKTLPPIDQERLMGIIDGLVIANSIHIQKKGGTG